VSRERWSSLALQVAIFVAMCLIAVLDSDTYLAIVSVGLVVLPPIAWSVAGVLVWTSSQDPGIRSLSDAADNAITTAINSTVAAVIGGIILLRMVGFLRGSNGDLLAILIGFVVINTSALPSFRFLRTWHQVWSPMSRERENKP